MDIKKIKAFMMVIDNKSFSSVAEILEISQPAVSKQIKSLEKTLGVPLLHRDSFEPTEAGRIVYRKGKQFLESWEELVEECRNFHNELSGQLRVGASSIPGTYFVPSIAKNFLHAFPRVEIQLSITESEEVVQQIMEEKLDVGFVGSEVHNSQITNQFIAKDKLVVIGPTESEAIVSLDELREEPFIFRSKQSGTWKAAQKGFQLLGYSIDDLNCIATVPNTEGAIAMVEGGLGYSIVSDIAAKKALTYKKICIIAELPVERSFYAIHLSSKKHNKLITSFIEQ
ncbi:selenium metabolism-associated LysR family transcriptional regulator [Evansella sp. AB-rgal1]|uniref:selenium metabolism-associated LysR family transcriptional regulator n=1 Tax=Evansella sp. AB-rgal1 TaxID=3242696 RepID=UPI00359F009C